MHLHHINLNTFRLSLCVSYVSLYFVTFRFVVGTGSIAGSIYCSVYLLSADLSFLQRFLFYWLHLLTLGYTSAESLSHAQLVRAELPSNGSSEPRSESFSKLSSHQIPHSLCTEGTTTARGLYAHLFFVLTHYAFGGVSALCVLFALSTPLRPRGRIGVFRRREGPPRQSISDTPFFRLWLFGLFSFMRRSLMPRGAACGSTFLVGPFSLLLDLRLRHCARLCAGSTCTGADGCAFPSATAWVFMHRIAYVIALDRLFRGVVLHPGDRTCFPGRD